MAIIVTVANQKGGVGKTTSAVNIGSDLADKGYRVLLVDNDEQASLTESVGLDPYDINPSISDVYLENCKIEDAIYMTGLENLHILPSDIFLSTVPGKLEPNPSKYLALKHSLTRLSKVYDYIIIDCPPSLGLCTVSALYAADYVVIPCSPSIRDRRALPLIHDSIKEVKKRNKKLVNLGVLITKRRNRVKDHEDGVKEIENEYDVCGSISFSTEAEKEYEGLPTVVFNKSSKIAQQYGEVTDFIITHTK